MMFILSKKFKNRLEKKKKVEFLKVYLKMQKKLDLVILQILLIQKIQIFQKVIVLILKMILFMKVTFSLKISKHSPHLHFFQMETKF